MKFIPGKAYYCKKTKQIVIYQDTLGGIFEYGSDIPPDIDSIVDMSQMEKEPPQEGE